MAEPVKIIYPKIKFDVTIYLKLLCFPFSDSTKKDGDKNLCLLKLQIIKSELLTIQLTFSLLPLISERTVGGFEFPAEEQFQGNFLSRP